MLLASNRINLIHTQHVKTLDDLWQKKKKTVINERAVDAYLYRLMIRDWNRIELNRFWKKYLNLNHYYKESKPVSEPRLKKKIYFFLFKGLFGLWIAHLKKENNNIQYLLIVISYYILFILVYSGKINHE